MVGAVLDEQERPVWLLKQVRDLTENWEIPLGEDLEKYLDQLENVEISFDDGKSTLNFVEAALFIQGSACVYSKKVEYLYALAVATLEMIMSRKKQQQASSIDDQGRDKDITFDQHTEDDDLLDLDDIKESDNLELRDEAERSEAVHIIPRIPFALMPKNDMNRRGEDVLLNQKGEVIGNRNDFKMNTCILHSSGALLIDVSSVSMLEKSFAARSASTPNAQQGYSALATQGNTKVNDHTFSVTNLHASTVQANPVPNADEMDNAPAYDIAGGDDDYDGCHDATSLSPVSSRIEDQGNPRLREFQRRAKVAEIAATKGTWKDPWEELDPYAVHKHMEKPFKKGRPFKLPPELKSLLTKQKKRKRDDAAPFRFGSTQLSPIVEFCGKDYHKKRPNNKLGGTIFPEFEYLSQIENKKRKEARRRERRLLVSRLTTDQIADIESIAQPPTDDNDVDDDDFDCNDGMDNNSISNQDNRHEFLRDDPFVDNMFEPMQDVVLSNYEDLVRQYIGRYIEEAENYAQQTELSKRVKEWQDKILPVLEQEDQHQPFDIHNYGSEILQSFEDSAQKTFKDIVRDKERHEVCRYFLSTLLLANMNNIEILQSEADLEMDMMNLRIIDKSPAYKAISNYKAPSLQD